MGVIPIQQPMLKIEGLNIEFHDKSVPETVVHDLNLTMEEGEIIGIVGESGSGKSMTALAVAGLLRRKDMKKTGRILFADMDLLNCSRNELRNIQGSQLSMVFQDPQTSLNPVKKIGWQIEESLLLHTDMTKKERMERAKEVLLQVELTDVERVYTAYPHELSGGMRQRVMIAAAIVQNPKLLIADEPTTALDVTVQDQIIQLLRRLNKEKKMGILFISHDLSLVKKLCTHVLVMQGGYVVEAGMTQEIFRNPEMEYTKKLIASIPQIRKKTSQGTIVGRISDFKEG